MKILRRRSFVQLATLAVGVLVGATSSLAQPGTYVGSVTFSVGCNSGLGVGIAYDGTYLWYSCYGDVLDLHRADPNTGTVAASYDIVPDGGLGALSYDATRNAIWAGEGGGGPGAGPIYRIDLDGSQNVIGVVSPFSTNNYCGLDDGLAFDARNVADPTDDVLYYSDDCGTTVIDVYAISGGAPIESFVWGGGGCYSSGLAVGGPLLYQGSDGCSHVWVIDKASKAPAYDFTTIVAGDPSFRDEDLECDTNTFAALGKHVMWSKEAYSPMRAHAFEIEFGSCGIGGRPACDPVVPAVRTQGFWKRVCRGAHPSGESEKLPEYVECVNATVTFEDVGTVDEICEKLQPMPIDDHCEQAEAELMALKLNFCSGRIAECNCIEDPDLETAGNAAGFVDELLSNPERTFEDCVVAKSIADDLNNGFGLIDCP